MLDAGEISGRASTIVSFMTRPPEVLRAGAGPTDFLKEIV